MKRICYLLMWLLTGFSIAANENSQRNVHLLSTTETANATEEIMHEEWQEEDLKQPQEAEPEKVNQSSFVHAGNFICSLKR